MRALAAYIMRGRWSAITATTGLAVASLLLPPLTSPLGYLSAAAVVLVTLVQGPKEGMLNAVAATLATAAAALAFATLGLTGGHPILALMFAVMLWIPVWLLAVLLWISRSLAITLVASATFCGVLLTIVYVVIPDPAAAWHNWLTSEMLPALKEGGMTLPPDSELGPALKEYSQVLSGWLFASISFGWMISVLIARWWQSLLYKPGAFGEEFRQLRLGLAVAGGGVAIALLSLLGGQLGQWSTNLLFVAVALFLLQGIAVGHAIVKQTGANSVWLIAMYIIVVISPAGMIVAAALGLLDNGIDFRARFRKIAR